MHDYQLQFRFSNGVTSTQGYQSLITELGIADHPVMGQPLSAGGVPQVQSVMGLMKSASGGRIEEIKAYFNGNVLLVA